MGFRACVFDAYGTLFDVSAAARLAAAEPGREALATSWPRIAEIWRQKQLSYTWLRGLADAYTDFWEVTQNGLDFALEAVGLDDAPTRERLLQLYWELAAYPEVPEMLARLKAGGLTTAILSNGSPDMLNGAVTNAGIADRLDAVISVAEVGIFKPHRSVYELVEKRLGVTPAEVLFVSSNGWDAAAGSGFGFTVAWANRSGEPMERLPWTPHHVIRDLSAIPGLAGAA